MPTYEDNVIDTVEKQEQAAREGFNNGIKERQEREALLRVKNGTREGHCVYCDGPIKEGRKADSCITCASTRVKHLGCAVTKPRRRH